MNKLNNRKKKLLTIEDLVKFCETNQLNTFSSKDSGYQLAVQVPAVFKKVDKEVEDNSLLYCILKTCHIGLNRNGSYISEESMKAAMPTLKYKPILCNFTDTEDGKDFTSHDMEIDDDGNINYIERQVGCFTADEPYLEYDKEKDKTYVMAYAAIPRDYTEAADIIERKDGTKVSVELTINEMSFNSKEKYLQLDSFVFSGCTLLGVDPETGKEVGEGMEGARLDIADFSQENNSIMNYSEENKVINNKLIETLEKLNTVLSNFNINQAENANETLEEGGNQTVTKLEELMQKYNKTEADIEFETEGLSEEELEAKFAEVFGEESSEDPTSDEDSEEDDIEVIETEGCKKKKKCEEDEKEETSEDEPEVIETEGCKKKKKCEEDEHEDEEDELELIETEGCKKKKKCEEDNHKDNSDESENAEDFSSIIKYSVEVAGNVRSFEVSLDEKIYAIEKLVNTTYGESDNTYYYCKVYEDYVIMLDYWSGRAYKQSYSEEDDSYTLTGDRVEVYSIWVTKEEEDALNEMKANYSSISEKLEKYQNAEIKAQKEEILSDVAYAEFAETDEFKDIVKEAESLTVDELRTKCELAFAKLVKAKGNFAFREEVKDTKKKNKIGINLDFEQSDDSEPYGDYFKSLQTY